MTTPIELQTLTAKDAKFFLERLQELESRVNLFHEQKLVKQAIFYRGYKNLFCRKGRKAGGTETLLYPAARICGTSKNKLCHLIYPDAPSATRILYQTNRIKHYFPPEWEVKVTWTDKDRKVYFPLTDSLLVILGAHQWESMQGFESDYCAFDELADHDPRAYKYCEPNMSARNGVLLVNGAPPLNKHNFYNQIEKRAKSNPESWFFIRWNFRSNPYLGWSHDEIERRKREHYEVGDDDIWEIQYEANDYHSGKHNVLKSFDSKSNVIRLEQHMHGIIDPSNEYYVVFDPGYATCFAALFVVINRKQRMMYVIDEIYENDRAKISTPAMYTKAMRIIGNHGLQHVRWKYLYDCAATGFAADFRVASQGHAAMIPCVKQKDDEDTYFRKLNQLFAENRLLIGHQCASTKFEIENYTTDENGRYPDSNNHILDCLRYIAKHAKEALNIETYNSGAEDITVDKYREFHKSKVSSIEEWHEWPFL